MTPGKSLSDQINEMLSDGEAAGSYDNEVNPNVTDMPKGASGQEYTKN